MERRRGEEKRRKEKTSSCFNTSTYFPVSVGRSEVGGRALSSPYLEGTLVPVCVFFFVSSPSSDCIEMTMSLR